MDQKLKLRNLFRLLVGHGKVNKIDDSKPVQTLSCEILEGERDVPRFQDYGLSSNPPIDSHVFAICSGQRKDLIAICVQNKKRPKDLKPGETVLYNDKIELRLKDDIASFNTRKVEVSGVDLLKTLEDLVDYLMQQSMHPPSLHFKDISPLISIQAKLKGLP